MTTKGRTTSGRDLIVGLLVMLSSCARVDSGDRASAAPTPRVSTTQDSAGFNDRFEDMRASPARVTQRRLELLRDEIGRYAQQANRLPGTLRDLLALPYESEQLRPQERWLRDGWDRLVEYSAHADGKRYELRSAGVDGVSGTGDDVVLVGAIA